MSEGIKINTENIDLDVKKSIIQLFNSKEYHELKSYYDFKGIFDTLGIMRNENVHSNFLAWIINPDQNHGLGNYPIRKFLEMIVMSLFDCQYAKGKLDLFPEYLIDYIITGNYEIIDVKIEREKVIDKNKRIDIFIDLSLQVGCEESQIIDMKIILENKVYSEEHSEQTIEYYKWASKNFKENSELVFLYLSPIPNSELYSLIEQQCQCKKYIQINYQYLVDYVLEPCKMQQLSPETSSFLDNYLRCLSYPSIDKEENIKNGGLVMAISEREKKLLLDFWEGNKPLLLAVLNALKDNEDINEQERENIDNMISTISKKSNKDYGKYLFNGNKYGKGRLVLAVIKEYVKSKNPTFDELKHTFSDNIQGSSGVLQTLEDAENKDLKRFFMKPDEILVSSDNIEFVVSNDWGKPNIDRFIKVAVEQGFEITRVEE
ncbi:PD-(D/E)XK nuclease family protein [Clostridium sp. HMP27]|uniref:PDDEXK-like family protein n=1 Tax=Clostridium sp. HMP27 TaxID=1487921 RepID=UPI00068BDC7C|nr:PD-(D/E)XK nuclease family protein [Clostridium sp. HMP27]